MPAGTFLPPGLTTSNVKVSGGGTDNYVMTAVDSETIQGEANLTFDSSTLTVTGAVVVGSDGSGHDVTFYSDTGGDHFVWDSSAEKLTITGTNAATALDVADGNVSITDDLDVDGTTNLDAVDIDGNVQVDGTFSVGSAGTDYDVTFYGDTSGRNLTWNAGSSGGSLILADDAVLKIGTGGDINLYHATNVSYFKTYSATIMTLGDDTEADQKIIFDGHQVDYHIGLDDTADALVIGKGSALGTTPALEIDSDSGISLGGGARPSANYTTLVSRTYTAGGFASQFRIQGQITGAAGADMNVMSIGANTLVEAGSGTHDIAAGLALYAPTLNTAGSGDTEEAATLYIGQAMAGATGGNYSLFVDAGDSRFDGNIDMNSSGSILNVANSGNDWDATGIDVIGTAASTFKRTTSTTNSEVNSIILRMVSDGDAADGFAPQILFQISDTGVTNSSLGGLSFERAGADNTGLFNVNVTNGGAGNDALKLTAPGVLSVDLAGSGSAAQVDLFDEYDDPVELQRYTHMQSDKFSNENERKLSISRMLDMGVISEVPTSASGYHMNLQPMLRLVAGGIYQNRERIDSQYDEIDKRLAKIEQALGV